MSYIKVFMPFFPLPEFVDRHSECFLILEVFLIYQICSDFLYKKNH